MDISLKLPHLAAKTGKAKTMLYGKISALPEILSFAEKPLSIWEIRQILQLPVSKLSGKLTFHESRTSTVLGWKNNTLVLRYMSMQHSSGHVRLDRALTKCNFRSQYWAGDYQWWGVDGSCVFHGMFFLARTEMIRNASIQRLQCRAV